MPPGIFENQLTSIMISKHPSIYAARRPDRVSQSTARPAFTLVEVMISVALVLMIIYGVAKVFKLSTDAVGANQAVAAMVRDNRAAQATMSDDMHNCVTDSPLFIISSRLAFEGSATGSKQVKFDNGILIDPGMTGGFRNAEERRTDSDGDPRSVDLNGTSVGTRLASLSDRIPRLDRLGFCARGLFRRNTSADTKAYDAATSSEAFIWYGHTVYPKLHSVANLQPNFQYASERILGRMCYLLKDVSNLAASPGNYPLTVTSDPLLPLGYETQAKVLNDAGDPWLGRFDLGLATLDQWRLTVDKAYDANYYPVTPPTGFKQFLEAPKWYQALETLPTQPPPATAFPKIFRPVCDPNIIRSVAPPAISSKKLAATAPLFVANCTQFVVEYAGDFLNQDPADGSVIDVSKWVDKTGALQTGKTDGQIDYIVDKPTTDPKTWSRRIRWYGLPRDTTGPDPDGITRINEFDVVPLRDVVYSTFKTPFDATNFIRAVWEMEYPGSTVYTTAGPLTPALGSVGGIALFNKAPGGTAVQDADYTKFEDTAGVPLILPSTPPAPAPGDDKYKSSLFRYVNAWHNDSPAMVRVLFKVDDPSNRIQNGQWFEYVLSR